MKEASEGRGADVLKMPRRAQVAGKREVEIKCTLRERMKGGETV